MKKQILTVDIDDVLSHSSAQILAFSNERWGHEHTLEDFTEDLRAMWQVEPEEAEQRWLEYMDSGSMTRYEPITEALEALRKLSERYQVVALTSRRDTLLPLTEEWIASNYPDIFDKVVGAGIYGAGRADAHKLTKGEVLQQVGSAYHIDDQPKHCIAAAEVGVQAVLFGDYPWNRDDELPSGVNRCKDWTEVLQYFKKESSDG